MQFKIKILILIFTLIFTNNACINSDIITKNHAAPLCQITTPKTTDSKIMADKIISTTDGHLILFSFNGSIYKEYPEIAVNWIYVCDSEPIIVTGNFNHEIHLISFTPDYSIASDHIIFSQEHLMIDPTIIKFQDQYILTFTEINGNINNADPSQPNGLYTVRCYASYDLKSWYKRSDIISCNYNIEDGDLFSCNNTLYYIFEKEMFDKGPSSLNIISSSDQGNSWTDEKELISATADNEPAAILSSSNGYTLYYSSDIEHIGESYNKAAIYKLNLNKDFSIQSDPCFIDLAETEGILLYDVLKQENELLFLYSQNYLTENNLILKKIDVS